MTRPVARPVTRRVARRVSRARRGTALVQALLAALLGAIVLAAALDAVVRVARARGQHGARAGARAQLEQAATALTSDLRPITTVTVDDDPADLRTVADTAVEIAASLGGGIACAVAPATGVGSTVDLAAPPDAPNMPALAWWSTPPRPGDLLYTHDDAGTATRADDRWTARVIRAVSEGTTYCRTGPFAAVAATPADPPRLRLTLDEPVLPATISAGAPVRIARRRRLSLYRATDGWQLGVRDWDGSEWETVQPVAGPFDTPANRGLALEAVDATGTPVQVPSQSRAAELRVVLHASCSPYDRRLRCVDSTVAVVRPRGNT